jgi:hypothetical protein
MVSPKREYLRRRPETFGDFRLNLGKTGVQRRKRMREKPGFSGPFSRPFGGLAERRNDWLATQY